MGLVHEPFAVYRLEMPVSLFPNCHAFDPHNLILQDKPGAEGFVMTSHGIRGRLAMPPTWRKKCPLSAKARLQATKTERIQLR